ncbi:hypothetical protein Bca101_076818 [Brassica carinata]
MRETVAWRYINRDVVPFASTIVVECVTVGSTTLYKAAALRGLSFYVFVFYSYVVSTLVLLPLSLIYGRSTRLPSAKSPVFFKIFLLALLGFMSMIAGCKGVEYSSPTLASAISTLTPAFTFTLAIVFREVADPENILSGGKNEKSEIIRVMEDLNPDSPLMSGALVVVLYKGPKLLAASHYHHLTLSESSWILGGILLAAQYLLISVWLIIQTRIMEVYPQEITVVFLYSLCGTLISAPVCMFAEKNLTSFLLKPDVSLVSIMYTGPVYISLFKPLSIVIAVGMSAIFLGDAIHLGSVIGSVVLSLGFYSVIWGKAREDASKPVTSSEHYSPLLLARTVDDES